MTKNLLVDMKLLSQSSNLDELYPLLGQQFFTAGWHKKRASLWKSPRTEFKPMHWSYELGKLALDQAGLWMDTELAERRNLLLFNPVGDNDYDTVRTLVAAFQMIKPGEHAKPHRHTPNALRFVLEAKPGAFSVVDGVKLPMLAGDVLLTPGGSMHSHYNESDACAYWIDILDVPLVHLLEPMFFEPFEDAIQPIESSPEEHPYWFKHKELAKNWSTLGLGKELLRNERSSHSQVLDSQSHILTQCLNYHHLLENNTWEISKSTVSRIFCVAEGSGSASLGGFEFDWKFGDVLALPSWHSASFKASQNSRIFEVNDFPVLDKLGLYIKEQTNTGEKSKVTW
jgi:gentisate 1,2-dioxygenase